MAKTKQTDDRQISTLRNIGPACEHDLNAAYLYGLYGGYPRHRLARSARTEEDSIQGVRSQSSPIQPVGLK
mgnify:FL=1|jgi:hypothetical protein